MGDQEGIVAPCVCVRMLPVPGAGHNFTGTLAAFGNMRLRQDERPSWNSYDPLIWPAGSARWQLADDFGCDIPSHNGEVAVFKLENIRASL